MNHIPQISFVVEDLIFGFHTEKLRVEILLKLETCPITSVADPNVFGPPGSKIVIKTLIPTVLTFYFCVNANVHSKSNTQKTFVVAVLKVTDKISRIWIRKQR
jgi:hypothetical protein